MNETPGRCRVKPPCTKIRYRDKIAASLAIATIRSKDRTDRPKTERRPYRCPDCRGWHLTSKGGPR